MKKVILFIFFYSLNLFLIGRAEGAHRKYPAVEIRLASPQLVEIKPGNLVTASFIVVNNSKSEERFFEKVEKNPGYAYGDNGLWMI